MAISGVSAASFHAAASTQSTQSLATLKQSGRHANSLSDVDSTGSSTASTPSTTGKIGSKIGSKVNLSV
jgi:hypothetical protein